jgi:succinate dehydrogenase/fumarate reductase cytochrome b subunit
MSNEVDAIAGIGLDQKRRKSHWPARLDLVQSASGLFLGLFMWGHMAFVSSILISKVFRRTAESDDPARLDLRAPVSVRLKSADR